MKILVTGGAGYIGSHATLSLLMSGYNVVVLDNFSNSSPLSLNIVQKIAGYPLCIVKGDVRDVKVLDRLFRDHAIDVVMHFAGLKSVPESVNDPLSYYDNNVLGSLHLLQAMSRACVDRLVFSSSATVYGDVTSVPITEDAPLRATNPYGASKLHVEDMLRDLVFSNPRWRIAILRYFNPAGAHESGKIGEDPRGVPNNLMPFIAQVAVGRHKELSIYGDDYATHDGTGVRDYIHVMDLVEGHLAALAALDKHHVITCNLGTGNGYSVLDIVKTFSAVSGREIPYRIVDRRPGDIAQCFTDPSRAKALLNWQARRGLDQICTDHWRWQRLNPTGY